MGVLGDLLGGLSGAATGFVASGGNPLVAIGTGLLGAYGSHQQGAAAEDAANAQRAAAERSMQAQLEIARMQDAYAREAFARSQASMWPTQVGGNRAQSQLSALMGLGYLPTNAPFDTERAYIQQQISALGGPNMAGRPSPDVLAEMEARRQEEARRLVGGLGLPAGIDQGMVSAGGAQGDIGVGPQPGEITTIGAGGVPGRADVPPMLYTKGGWADKADRYTQAAASAATAAAGLGPNQSLGGWKGILADAVQRQYEATQQQRDQKALDTQSQLKMLMDRYNAIPNEPMKNLTPEQARAEAMRGFYKDPGYEFRLAEGQKAIDRINAARGRLGGAGVKDLIRFNQGTASDEYGRYVGNLQSLAGLAPVAAQAQSANAMNFGGQLGTIAQGIGDARTSAYQQIGAANSMQSIAKGNQLAGFTNSLLNMDWSGFKNPFGGGGGGTSTLTGATAPSPSDMSYWSYTNNENR